jgi:hypothetical protein
VAGTLEVGGQRWSAPSGVFYWVVDEAAERVDDPGAAAVLREVSEHNLGWLDVTGLDPRARRAVLDALLRLPEVAERDLPRSPARDDVIAQVRELAALAGTVPPGLSPARALPQHCLSPALSPAWP